MAQPDTRSGTTDGNITRKDIAVISIPSSGEDLPDPTSIPGAELGSGTTKTTSRGRDQTPSGISEGPASLASASPGKRFEFGRFGGQGLAKSDSKASVGRTSVKSHVSLPAIGTIPYGALQVHRPPDSSFETSSVETTVPTPLPIPSAAPMPPPKCLDNGDVFLLLDLPDRSIVGHDAMAVTVASAKMTGIRDIPSGAHLLWVADPAGVFRFGYWYITGPMGEVRVKQWDRFNEFLGEPASQVEVRDKKENIEAIYPKLVPYGYNGKDLDGSVPPPPPPKDPPMRGSSAEPDFASAIPLIWQKLTSAISKEFLDRVTKKTNVGEWLVETTDTASSDTFSHRTSNIFRTGTDSQLSFLFDEEAGGAPLPSLGSTGGYLTDTSSRIASMLGSSALGIKESDIVAELQFTFLTGMHLGNHACVQQWRYLVLKVILRAHHLAVFHPSLCRTLLQTLHAQMIYDERYFAAQEGANLAQDDSSARILDIIPGTRNKLHDALTVYKRRLNEELLDLGDQATQDQATAGHAFADLEAWFWRHGWDLRSDYNQENHQSDGPVNDDSDEEYAPVVVQLDESGKEVGLVSWGED